MNEEDEHFLSASHRKCILLSGTECHITNYLLSELARTVPGNIGPRSFSYGPRCARTVTTTGQYFPVRPSRSVSKRLLLILQWLVFLWAAFFKYLECFFGYVVSGICTAPQMIPDRK